MRSKKKRKFVRGRLSRMMGMWLSGKSIVFLPSAISKFELERICNVNLIGSVDSTLEGEDPWPGLP